MLLQWFAAFLDRVAVIVAPVALFAVSVSTIAIMVGWSRRSEALARRRRPSGRRTQNTQPWLDDQGAINLAAEVLALLHRFEALAARNFVALEQAVQPGLAVHIRPGLLRDMLHDVLTVAIERSPGGRVLLTAGQVAGRVEIAVSDDGQVIRDDPRSSWLGRAAELAALQDVTMDVDAREGEGTTVVLRLPADAAWSFGQSIREPVSDVMQGSQPAAGNRRADH
jgi:signal transduction histidine kinase